MKGKQTQTYIRYIQLCGRLPQCFPMKRAARTERLVMLASPGRPSPLRVSVNRSDIQRKASLHTPLRGVRPEENPDSICSDLGIKCLIPFMTKISYSVSKAPDLVRRFRCGRHLSHLHILSTISETKTPEGSHNSHQICVKLFHD